MEFGEKIKALREKRGMTLEQVGIIVGVGKSTVRKWETGDIRNMRRDKIQLLAKALGVTPGYLMGWTDDSSQSDNDPLWQRRESLRRDPKRRVLFDLAENGTEKDIDAAVALLDALKATNPDFYDGDDPA